MQRQSMAADGGVRGVLLNSSVLFTGDGSEELRVGADYLIRSLRYSNIPTGVSYAIGLSDAKVAALEKLARLGSLQCFPLNSSSVSNSLNTALTWVDNGGSILHVVSNYYEEPYPELSKYPVINIILNVRGGSGSKNPGALIIEKLEQLPLTICSFNRKLAQCVDDALSTGEDNLVVGYIMKPSRTEDFTKRGAFPLYPTLNGLMFAPLSFELPLASQLEEVDLVIHKATDEIMSIEISSCSDCSNKITYTSGMQELQSYMDQHPECCVIDPFSNIYPVVDRYKIQDVLLSLHSLNTEGRCKIRGPNYIKVNNFGDPSLKQRLSEAKLSHPSIVKPQVACGVADAHSMAIAFRLDDYLGLSVPLPAVVQEYVDHSSILFKFYVLGDKVFYAVKKSIPNADTLIKLSQRNGLKPLLFDSLKSLPTAGENQPFDRDGHKVNEQHDLDIGLVTDAASHLRRMLGLTIFGFDVVIQDGTGDHVIVDVNYLPSFKEVPDDIAIPAFWDAIKSKYEKSKMERK